MFVNSGLSYDRFSSDLTNYGCSRLIPKKPSLTMVSQACYIPKENELKLRGEDACFMCEDKQTIGVADGVGGWAKKGIDAGQYARQLMAHSEKAVRKEPKGDVDPQRVLNVAYSNTKCPGSSTACIITLKDTGKTFLNNFIHWLQASNVGDSGFMVFRNARLIYKSPIEQYRFNCPHQLANSEENNKSSCKASDPSIAMIYEVAVEEGDIVVAGTDGLLDNVYPKELEEVLEKVAKGGLNQKELASYIANLALHNSFDRYSFSPFAREASNALIHHRGGKIDDITVIISHIVNSKYSWSITS